MARRVFASALPARTFRSETTVRREPARLAAGHSRKSRGRSRPRPAGAGRPSSAARARCSPPAGDRYSTATRVFIFGRGRSWFVDDSTLGGAMDVGIIERNPQAAPAQMHAFASPRLAGPEVDSDLKAAAERLEEIRQHHLDIYAKRDVITQTTTDAGDRVDWVPVESQSDGAPAEPPSLDEAGHNPERPTLPAASSLLVRNVELGPPGTVPVLRKDVDGLRPVGSLQDYLAKGPYRRQFTPPDNPHPPAIGAQHKYAHAYQFVTNYGTEGYINTWKPYVQWSNEFSLGQRWTVRGSGATLQTLEVGAQTYKDIYGDWELHLFIYYTTNGYSQSGDNLGGYNTDVKGWVQVGTSSFPGMRVAESVAGGDQYD